MSSAVHCDRCGALFTSVAGRGSSNVEVSVVEAVDHEGCFTFGVEEWDLCEGCTRALTSFLNPPGAPA